MSAKNAILGIDIGGTGLKAAIVDCAKGNLLSERVRVKTPQPATPEAILNKLSQLKEKIGFDGSVGCGFPGVIKNGIVTVAPNLDPSWIGYNIADGLKMALSVRNPGYGNDADAAGVAEMTFGAGKNIGGTVMMVTLGTGIGTALFRDGTLTPNTELGHLEFDGKDAEAQAAESVRVRKDWSWKKWGSNVNKYLLHLEYLVGVEAFIIGGGVSKRWDKFSPHINLKTATVQAATMGNLAGIVGAAMLAYPPLARSKRKGPAHL